MSSNFVRMRQRELPFELVMEILARVPVKDLIRFRCVCKSWRSLFQDERFIKQHMDHAQRMVLLFRGSEAPVCNLIFENGNPNQTILQELDLNIGDKSLLSNSRLIGRCHGLFCFDLLDNSFGIWNPSLRELRRIRTSHIENWAEIGFGYDHSTQDYKLVLLIPDKEGTCSKAQVLSLKSGVSRMIDFPCLENSVIRHMRAPGTLVGENIYWQLYDKISGLMDKILSFDLVSETFNYYPGVPVPSAFEVFRGGLCTIDTDESDLGYELAIWSAQHEKEKNGVVKSWTKTFRLSWDIVESLVGPDSSSLMTAITHAGLLIFIVGDFGREAKLLAYNLEEKSLSLVEISLSFKNCRLLQLYIETLVPIPGAL